METPAETARINDEPEGVAAARARAAEANPPSAEVGALLAWAATTVGAHTAVEVGSAGGVSGLWMLEALPAKGVLTSIEPDPPLHALAEQATAHLSAAGRVRTILGDAVTVLPRLADGGYDLMLLQGRNATVETLTHAGRLLKPGGMLLCRGLVDAHTDGFFQALTDNESFIGTALPIDGFLTIATRVDPEEL